MSLESKNNGRFRSRHLQARACEPLRAAIRATLVAKDRVTPDLGGGGSTESFADALIERVRVTRAA